ncbi:hypothetical protein Vretimale_151 [Volvox reticuliferus]|uniref:SprT-like domain-containing protein n=1 Tax=Volvox reticuliferus TaxID=1737510 RepID=A0A8J4D1G3_9CHLO|nr:hypothetical protein Vretimale_151 [Volvox reticuliferus]
MFSVLQCKSPQTGTIVMSMAIGSGSGGSSPEDKPLTVSRTQRLSAVRRRIVDSDDDEADAPSSLFKSPRRLTAARPPVTTPSASTRPFQNLTNLFTLNPERLTASEGQKLIGAVPSNHDRSVREGLGKPGILELAILLTPEDERICTAAGSSNTSATAEGLPLNPARDKSASTEDPESPLVVPRSTRVPRTARRVIYEDASDSESVGGVPPGCSGCTSTTASGRAMSLNEESRCTPSPGVRIAITHEAGGASTPHPDHPCRFASIHVMGAELSSYRSIQGIEVETGAMEEGRSKLEDSHLGSRLQKQLPSPGQWPGSGAAFGSATQSPAQQADSGAEFGSATQSPAQQADSGAAFGSATQSPAQQADSGAAFGSATQSPAQQADSGAAFGSATQSPAQQADSGAAFDLGLINDPGLVPISGGSSFAHTSQILCSSQRDLQIGARAGPAPGTINEGCPHVDGAAVGSRASGSQIGTETATEHAVVTGEPLLDASYLVKVPRRRQGMRDGSTNLGVASNDGFGELMSDLCGELELLTQLRGLSFASNDPTDADAPDSPEYISADEDLAALESPRQFSQLLPPQLLFPPPSQSRHVGVPDITLLSNSNSSFTASSKASRSGSRSFSPGAENDAAIERPCASRSSPEGLLDVYHHAQPAAVWTTGPVAGPRPPSCVGDAGVTAPPAGIAGDSGCADRDRGWSAGSAAGREGLPSVNPDSDLERQLEIGWKRPPTTARRRAVVIDDSSASEANSPQQPGPACTTHAAGTERHTGSHVNAGDAGTGNGSYGCGAAGSLKAVEITEVLAALSLVENGQRRSAGGPGPEVSASRPPATSCEPPYDPFEIASSSTTADSSDSESSGGGFQDCALETPLPWRPSRTGARDPTGGAAFVTPMRDDQADRGGMELSGWREQPQPQRTLPADSRNERMNVRRRNPRGTGARGGNAVAEQRAFLAARRRLAQELYEKWNALVFGGQLPANLPLVWNSRLTATAGQVVGERSLPGTIRRIAAKLELSPRLIDSIDKLRNTLSHEMCHVAVWHISQEYDRPHGPAWERWARRFMNYDPSLVITRTHDYISQYAHRWRCTNVACGKEYGRQRRTINADVHVCAVCRSKLKYLGHFDKYGNLKAPKTAAAAAPGTPGAADGVGGLMTGTASKPLNGFAQFCKENFRSVRTSMPAQTPASAIFKHMGLLYQKQKANVALIAAAGGGLTPGLSASAIGLGLSPAGRTRPVLSPRGGDGTHNQQASSASSGEHHRRGGSGSRSRSRGPMGRLSRAESDELLPRMVDLSLLDDGK